MQVLDAPSDAHAPVTPRRVHADVERPSAGLKFARAIETTPDLTG